MSEEEDLVGTDIDRAIRAAMMGAGQVAEAVKRVGQERDRNLAEQAQAAVREQAQVTSRVHAQVSREFFWAGANGERIANAATYGATLSNVDPGARDVYEIVREEAHQRYGLDVDSIRARFPDSEEQRRNALMHAVDDYFAAGREEAAAEADRARAAGLEQKTGASAIEADGDIDRGESHDVGEEHEVGEESAQPAVDGGDSERDAGLETGLERNDSAGESAQHASASAVAHEALRDRLHAEGASEESAMKIHEQEVGSAAPAAATAEVGAASAVQRSGAPTSAAAKASHIAATSYPKSANQTLTESRKAASPRARVNRGSGPQKERGKDLGR